jgi:hypothetical protein
MWASNNIKKRKLKYAWNPESVIKMKRLTYHVERKDEEW